MRVMTRFCLQRHPRKSRRCSRGRPVYWGSNLNCLIWDIYLTQMPPQDMAIIGPDRSHATNSLDENS